MGRTMQAGIVVLMCMMASGQGATKTWNNDNGNGAFTTADNWVEDAAPVSGVDSVILDPSAGTAWFSSEFTIASGQSMTSTNSGVAMRVGPGGDLTVATGGSLNFATSGAGLAENGSLNQRMTFEAGATVSLAGLYTSSGWTMEFVADAGGVTKVDVGFFSPKGPLELDLTNYDTANGNTLVLFDYSGGAVSGVFSSTNVIGAPADGSVNYAYDQGGGDLAIAYVLDIPYMWDGGGIGDDWTTASNWNFDAVPGASDEVVIGTGFSVTNGQAEFGTLTIATNSTVAFGEDGLPAASTIMCEGTVTRTGVWRLSGGGTLTLTGTGRMGSEVTWLDLQGADLSFYDGASFDNTAMAFEARGVNAFGFVLSSTGFATLDLGQLWDAGSTWADKTFNIDISGYDRYLGTTIILMDFSAGGLGGTFDPDANSPAVDITGHSGGTLSWDAVNHDLILEMVSPPPKGAVFVIR